MPFVVKVAPQAVPEAREIVPGFLPTSDEDIVAQTAYLDSVILSPVNSSSARVVIKDKQGTPIPILDIDLDRTQVFSFGSLGARMEGGITVSCAQANAVALRMKFRLA